MESTVIKKLHEVALAIGFVEKHGFNDHHKYSYVQAVDVVNQVRQEMLKRGLQLLVTATEAEHLPYGSKGAHLTTVKFSYGISDVETGDTQTFEWIGAGADTGGDKGLYKAMTGSLKYFFINLFMLPMSDDPERDQLTEAPSKAHKDDDRPAAPKIPVDRAKTILKAAQDVNLAAISDEGTVTLEPVFKAVLAQHGVDKIGLLNVDQAESVEAFLKSEAA